MTAKVTIPNTFATATTAIPLSQLDGNFSNVNAAINNALTFSNYAVDTGAANNYAITITGQTTTYAAGIAFQFKAANTNTGASTLNVNGQGTQSIVKTDGSALVAGDIVSGAIATVMYDGTNFQLLNDSGGAGGTFTNLTVTGTATINVANVTTFNPTITNAQLANSSATLGNSTITLGGTTTTVGNLTLQNANITSVSTPFPNSFLANSNVTIGNTAVNLGGTITTINNATLVNANVASGNVTVTTVSDQYGNVRAIADVGSKTSAYTLTKADVGRYVTIGSGGSINITDNVFAAGDAVSIFNNTNANANIVCTITTAYIAGTDSDKASVNVATRGLATVLFTSNVACVIAGNVS